MQENSEKEKTAVWAVGKWTKKRGLGLTWVGEMGDGPKCGQQEGLGDCTTGKKEVARAKPT